MARKTRQFISKRPGACVGYSWGFFMAGAVVGLMGMVAVAIGCVCCVVLVVGVAIIERRREQNVV